MTLEQLQNDMKQAMKDKDVITRDVLRSVIGAVKKTAIDERCDITEELVDRVLLKEKKTLQEQIDTCPADRLILLEDYKNKMTVLDNYCPKLLDNPEEIKDIIIRGLAAAGVEPVKANKGAAMKLLMPQFKGKADMKIVNQVIGELLK